MAAAVQIFFLQLPPSPPAIVKITVSSSLFAAELFCPLVHRATARLFLSSPFHSTAESHLLCLSGVHITNSY